MNINQETQKEALERRLADLQAQLPAHSIPPAMMMQIDELETELAQLEQEEMMSKETQTKTPDKTVEAGHPVAVTDDDFETLVLNAQHPVIVDFWAPWCMPCRSLAPTLEEIAAEYDGQVLVTKVNIDENRRWAEQYGVRSIPTLLFIWKGHEAGRIVGAVPAQAIKQQLSQML
jgi:thioredoxin 1